MQVAAIAPPPAVTTRPSRSAGKRIVVVDAGHGGNDPGAVGIGGILEKHIALIAARELAGVLSASGRYQVILTRDRDQFIRLRDRVARGRAAKADLLISLHADSIDSNNVRGSHVYSLSDGASDAEAEALAAKENKSDIIAGVDLAQYNPDVGDILLDLAQRETNNVSAAFAGVLIDELVQARLPVLSPRPHRQAGFAVLTAPDVPSVLIELGYLSNPKDEAALTDGNHRKKLTAAIARAIDRHFRVLATNP